MATSKKLTNRFQSDIDLCQNQIKNGTWEYWESKTFPDDETCFDGRTIFLKNEIKIREGQPDEYIYEKGSVCVYNKADTGPGGKWNKQLSSMQTDDIMEAIYELWYSKSGVIHRAKDIDEMNGWLVPEKHESYWELDLVIVDVDRKYNNNRTLYVGYGDGTGSVQATRWDFVCIINDSPRKETTIAAGTSRISNEVGDEGACMTFDNTGGVVSGVAVDKNAGTRAQMYAIYKGSRIGSRLNVNENGIYYMNKDDDPDAIPTISDEIATIGDLVTGASAYRGTFPTYYDLTHATMTPDATDYAYVLHDEEQQRIRKEATGIEEIAPSTRYYWSIEGSGKWKYSCDVANTSIRLLGDVPDAPAGTQFNLPYYFYTVENTDDIDAHVKSVSLDNKKTIGDYSLKIKGAHVVDTDPSKIKAGLYNKTLADAKLNIDSTMVMTGLTTRNRKANVWEINTPRRKLDNSGSTDQPFFNLEQMDYAGDKAGLYTKAMADAKLDILTGAPDGKAYKLPYYFETVPDASKIRVKSHTITLDNKKEVDTTSYFIDVVGATADKAGLMTAADKIKLDGLVVDEYSTPEATDKAMSVRLAMEKIKELGHDFVGNVETHDKLVELIYKPGSTTKKIDINDIAVVLDDSGYPGTPSHYKECWRYRCIDASKLGHLDAWAPEYRISNIPFTTKQWNAINSYEIEVTNGLSYISNLKGDGGACLKFLSTDQVDSAVAVNNGGQNGIAAQIYAIQHGDPTQGVKLNVRKSGLYYLKNKATPATEDPDDELTVRGDFKSISFTLSESGWATPATGSTFWLQEVTVAGIKATDNPIVSADYSDGSTVDEIRELQEEAGKILKAETLDGGIRFFAEDDLGKDIKILVRVI